MSRFKIDIAKFFYDKKRPIRSFFAKIFGYLYFFARSFNRNECYLKASLLTFYSLIAIVPLLAIGFSVAKGLGVDEFLQKQIIETFHEQQDVISEAAKFAHALLANIKSQAILGVGAVFLFVCVFSLFENIEKSLNAIWNIKKHRSFVRRAINYLTALIVFPLVFIFSTSMTIFLNGQILNILQAHAILKNISEYFVSILHFAPYALMCAVFSVIYIFTPNAKIFVKSRILAGILAGVIFQLWQLLYIYFQVSISNYNAVYGSFAALPLFVIWMQVNFVIFLFCAVVAAQLENYKFLFREHRDNRYRLISQKQLALLVVREITIHFLAGEKPVSIEKISSSLGISTFDAREILNALENSGVIAEIFSGKKLEQYQLIVNPELLTIASIEHLMEKSLLKSTLTKESKSLQVIKSCYEDIDEAVNKAGVNCTLKNLAQLLARAPNR